MLAVERIIGNPVPRVVAGGYPLTVSPQRIQLTLRRRTADPLETHVLRPARATHYQRIADDAILGKAELTDVVEAMTQAELTLDATKVIRDQMISAYQEIMRMPI